MTATRKQNDEKKITFEQRIIQRKNLTPFWIIKQLISCGFIT